MSFAFQVMHLNLWRENPDPFRSLRVASEFADVINLNEAADSMKSIMEFVIDSDGRWGYLTGDEGDAKRLGSNLRVVQQNGVLFKKGFFKPLADPRVQKMCDEVPGSPMRTMVTARFDVPVLGREFRDSVTHLNAHIQLPQWYRLPRQGEAREHMRGMEHELREDKESYPQAMRMISMDSNVDQRWDRRTHLKFNPRRSLKDAGYKTVYDDLRYPSTGTKGKRLIDLTAYDETPFFKALSVRVVDIPGPDHNGLVTTFRGRDKQ